MWSNRGRWFGVSAHNGKPDAESRKSCARDPTSTASETAARSRRGEREEARSGAGPARGQQDHRPRVHPSGDYRSKPARPAGASAIGACCCTGADARPASAGACADAHSTAAAAASSVNASTSRGIGSRVRAAVAERGNKRGSARDSCASGHAETGASSSRASSAACLGGLVDLRTLGSVRGGAASASVERKALASFRRQHMMRFLGDANLVVLQMQGRSLCCGRSQARLIYDGEAEEEDEDEKGERDAGVKAAEKGKGRSEEEEEGTEKGEDEEEFGRYDAVSSVGARVDEEEGDGKERAELDVPRGKARGGASQSFASCILAASEIGCGSSTKSRETSASPSRVTASATGTSASGRQRSSRSRWEQALSDWTARARRTADEVVQELEDCEGKQRAGRDDCDQNEKRRGFTVEEDSLVREEAVGSLEARSRNGSHGASGAENSRGSLLSADVDHSSAGVGEGDSSQLVATDSSTTPRTARTDDGDRRTDDREDRGLAARAGVVASGLQQPAQADAEGKLGSVGNGSETCGDGGGRIQTDSVVARDSGGCNRGSLAGASANSDGNCNSCDRVVECTVDEGVTDAISEAEAKLGDPLACGERDVLGGPGKSNLSGHVDNKGCEDDDTLRKEGEEQGGALGALKETVSSAVCSARVNRGSGEEVPRRRQRKERRLWLKYSSLCGAGRKIWRWGRRNCKTAS